MAALALAALLLTSGSSAIPFGDSANMAHQLRISRRQYYGYGYGYGGDRFNYGYLGLGLAIIAVFLIFAVWATVFRMKYGYWGCGCCCVSREKRLERRRSRCHHCGALTIGPCQCTPMWVPVHVAPGGTAFAMTPPEYAAHLHSMANAQPGAPGPGPGPDAVKTHPRPSERGVTEYFQSQEHTPAAPPVGGYYNAANDSHWAAVPGQVPGHWRPAPPPPAAQQLPPAGPPANGSQTGTAAPPPQNAQTDTVAADAAGEAAPPKKGFKRFFKSSN